MEEQLQRPQHYYEEDPQNTMEVEGKAEQQQHHHGEKKSVLKKVKDKAKKIKDKIKNHEHEHGGGLRREDNYQKEYEEEDDDDYNDEISNDPEVHGAPIYESTVIRSSNLPRETNTNLEMPNDSQEDRYEHDLRDRGQSRPFPFRPESERPPAMEADAPERSRTLPSSSEKMDRDKPNIEEPKIQLELPVGLEEDPHSPNNNPEDIPSPNSQSKVTDPTGTGGKEADVAPLVRQFNRLNVHDAPVSEPESEQRTDSGDHDQFTPQPTPTRYQLNAEPNPVVKPENLEWTPKSEEPPNSAGASKDTLAGRMSSAPSAVAKKAVSAKDMVASKLGYGGDHKGGPGSFRKPVSESASEYAHKVAETLPPVHEKVAGAGSGVMSKIRGRGGVEYQGGDKTAAKGANNVVSLKEYLSEKFKPGDEDMALSEAITNALHKKKEAVRGTGDEQQRGKVMMSEEVASRLGTGAENKREGEDALAAGQESSGQGVVEKLKDAVSSWLGKSNGMQTAQNSVGRSFVSDVGSGSTVVGQGEDCNVESSRATG